MVFFDPRVTSFIKLLINISVLHNRCYLSDDGAPSVLLVLHTLQALPLILSDRTL